MNDEIVLSAKNVAKSYGNVHALKGVNFDIHRGQVTTLFGENGAGKSTLMKILSGVVTPTEGEIVLDSMSSSVLRQRPGTAVYPSSTRSCAWRPTCRCATTSSWVASCAP